MKFGSSYFGSSSQAKRYLRRTLLTSFVQLAMGILGKLLTVGSVFTVACAILLGVAMKFQHALPPDIAWYTRAVPAWIGIIMSQIAGLPAQAIYSEFKALDAVLTRATPGDADSVLRVIDETGWSGHMLINIGDRKGEFLDAAVLSRKPKLAVELGTFMGYSSVRIARLLPTGGRLISVDPSSQAHAISNVVLQRAGLHEKVELAYDYSHNILQKLAKEGVTIDLLFLDHLKELYLKDLQIAMALGLLKKGSVVVGDNIGFPGAPDFKAFVMNRSNGFDTVVHESFVEYSNVIPDAVTVSTYTL